MKIKFLENKSKRKIALSLIIVIVLSINIIISSLIFFDIRVVKSPEMTLDINIIEINSNEIVLQTKLSIENPNQFDLIIQNLSAITKTNDGSEIVNIILSGGEITSNDNKTFISTDQLSFNDDLSKNLTTTVTGIVGLRFLGFIKKTIPIVFNVITSLEEALNNIALPQINIKGDFGEITSEGIDFITEVEVKNPNTFDILIEKLSVVLKTENDEIVGQFNINGNTIYANSKKILNGNGKILIVALNAKTLFINLSASSGMKIAGISKSIDIATEIQIDVPNLGEIISTDTPTEAFIDADMKFKRNGFLSWGFISYMTLKIINPNKIDFIIKDVVFSIYRVDDVSQNLVGQCVVNESFVEAENTTSIPAEVYLPLKLIIKGQRLFLPQMPNGFFVIIRANVTISGIDQGFWIGVSGYQDLRMFT